MLFSLQVPAYMIDQVDFKSFQAQLITLLQGKPRGTIANLTDIAVATLNDNQVVCAFLSENGTSNLGETFALDLLWYKWRPAVLAWLASPSFTEPKGVVAEARCALDHVGRRCKGRRRQGSARRRAGFAMHGGLV